MVCQCHQLQLCHFALGLTWRALSDEMHLIFSQFEKKKNEGNMYAKE